MGRPQNTHNRDRIIKIAYELFYERGIKGVSMDDVAQACGLKKANLFHYFPTKDHLALAAVDYAATALRESVKNSLQSNKSNPIAGVNKIFESIADDMDKNHCARGCFIGNLAQEISDHHERLRQKVAALLGQWTSDLCEYFRGCQNQHYFKKNFKPQESAESILSLFEGAVLCCKARKDTAPLRHAQHMAADYLKTYQKKKE